MQAGKLKTIGIALVVLSGVFWLIIPVVHLFNIPLWLAGTIDVSLFVAAEIVFWVGAAILGKPFVQKMKEMFKFWRRKSS